MRKWPLDSESTGLGTLNDMDAPFSHKPKTRKEASGPAGPADIRAGLTRRFVSRRGVEWGSF